MKRVALLSIVEAPQDFTSVVHNAYKIREVQKVEPGCPIFTYMKRILKITKTVSLWYQEPASPVQYPTTLMAIWMETAIWMSFQSFWIMLMRNQMLMLIITKEAKSRFLSYRMLHPLVTKVLPTAVRAPVQLISQLLTTMLTTSLQQPIIMLQIMPTISMAIVLMQHWHSRIQSITFSIIMQW